MTRSRARMLAPTSRNLKPASMPYSSGAPERGGLGCLAGSLALIKRRLASRSANGLKDSVRDVFDRAT
jgi:hypothetical protein